LFDKLVCVGAYFLTEMRLLFLFLGFLTLAVPARADWVPIFDGKDLTDWSGDPRLWRVEDGVIIGETNDAAKKVESSSFLIWEGGRPEDFELEFQARITGTNNSGVQYRSRVVDPKKWSVSGYQMDLHPQPSYLGMLYDEKGRGVICENGKKVQFRDKAKITGSLETAAVVISKWNSYRIVAKGRKLHHFINGTLVVEVKDESLESFSAKGIIALQLHEGAAMKVEFKDLRIQQSEETKKEGQEIASWLWKSKTPVQNEKVFFRREMQLPPNISKAIITVACDDEQHLFVNGKDIGTLADWANASTYDVTSSLNPGGRNVIALECRNQDGPAGMALRFGVTLQDGEKLNIISDANWRCSSEAGDGWQKLDFPAAASWQKAYVIAKMGCGPWGNLMPAEPLEVSRNGN
jgi:hypothetical protein